MNEKVCDITIVGAGPVGLAAAYYAGHRDASVQIVESLGQLGGAVAAVYPEKSIYDIAGHPEVGGQQFVELCAAQGLQYGAALHLGEEIATLERLDEGGEQLFALASASGRRFCSRALIVTAGHGAFEPRKLALAGVDAWEGRGLHYFVREKEVFRDKNCVIVGGGDSALDWTLGLQDTARLPITLLHRRERFRALESSVTEARRLEAEGKVQIVIPSEVRAIAGNGLVERLTVENTSDGERFELACDALITLLGFHSHLGAIADWGLALHGKRQLLVEPRTMATSLAGVYAAGDVAGYEGKITLISVGFGEAAIAANNAIATIRGEKVQPKYSTD